MTNSLHCTSDLFNGRCIAAYATFDRFSGKCGLLILWEKGLSKKELAVHSFLLCFNHDGIKNHTVKKLTLAHGRYWEEELVGYVCIDFSEAISLLQDAYKQNVRFGTVPALGCEKYEFFLANKCLEVDRERLLQKLSVSNLTPVEFTNIYFSACKRMDNALLYDLSSPVRQKSLGTRDNFLLFANQNLCPYTFLKSQVLMIKKHGKRQIVSAFIVVSTPDDEIMKISYNLVLLRYGKGWRLDGLQELSRHVLTADHPENPINYRVFCSVYQLAQPALIKNWLASSPDIFLTGEFAGGLCYKLLQSDEVPRKSIDVLSGIISEFMLTEKELFVYAQKPFHLASMESLLVQTFKDKVKFKQKYYLPVRGLYQAAMQGASLEGFIRKSSLVSHPAHSAFLLWQGYGQVCNNLKREALYQLQLDRETLYLFFARKKRGSAEPSVFIEYYISGNWLRLNVYNGSIGAEIKKLGVQVEVIKERGFGQQGEFLNVPQCKKEQWEMYKRLNLMGREAPSLKAMGLIPSVRGMARRLGTLLQ